MNNILGGQLKTINQKLFWQGTYSKNFRISACYLENFQLISQFKFINAEKTTVMFYSSLYNNEKMVSEHWLEIFQRSPHKSYTYYTSGMENFGCYAMAGHTANVWKHKLKHKNQKVFLHMSQAIYFERNLEIIN